MQPQIPQTPMPAPWQPQTPVQLSQGTPLTPEQAQAREALRLSRNGIQVPSRPSTDGSLNPAISTQVPMPSGPSLSPEQTQAREDLRMSRNTPQTQQPGGDHKKTLLRKLMENVMSKPGQNVHEMANGVKTAVGAYKNFSKEWDNLHGISPATGPTANSTPAIMPSQGSQGIQGILRGIQEKKGVNDGGGGPGYVSPSPSSMPKAPNLVAPQTMNAGASGPSPIQQMPPLPPVNVPTPQSGYRTPPPVSSLGVFGY